MLNIGNVVNIIVFFFSFMTLIVYCKIKSLENVTHLIQYFFSFY